MKAQPLRQTSNGYESCAAADATHVMLNMPGPIQTRIIPVIQRGTRQGTHCWSWNGDVDKPTLKPSILSDDGTNRCHTFVNDGRVQFLEDCTHELKGQTADLLDVDW